MTGNTLNYEEVQHKLNEINATIERVEKALNNINRLIYENVNSNKGIFDGNAASQFMEKWKNLEEQFPDFIQKFKSQATNVKIALDKAKASDVYSE